jgi:hypothetical protein
MGAHRRFEARDHSQISAGKLGRQSVADSRAMSTPSAPTKVSVNGALLGRCMRICVFTGSLASSGSMHP